MKRPSVFRLLRSGLLAAAIVALLGAFAADAVTLSWNGNGSLGGSGIWNTNSTANWWGSGTAVWPAPGGTNDVASFGGTVGTVTCCERN